jgi:dolichol-phosphate mannosyltransferase
LLSKYTIALLGPPVFIFMLLDRRSRRLLWTPWPYLASVLALAIFSPVIRWNLQHNWESFAFQTIGRLSQPPTFSLHMLAISVLALLSPMAVIGCVQALKSGSVSANLQERSLRLLLLLTLAPLAIFTCFSLMHKIKLNWTGPLWLAFVPILGYWLWRGEMQVRPYRGTFHSVLWRASFVILLLLFGAALHALSLGLAGAPPSTRMALPVAWQELGAAVETIEKEVEQSVGYAPLVVGMDKSSIASELAFYRGQVAAAPGRVKEGPDHTASRSLFGLPALMWERWVTPREHLGRTMILISDKTKDLEYFRLAAWFDTLGFMHVLPVSKDGSLVAEFYYRIGYGYQHPLLALAENRRDPFADDEAQRRAPRAPQRHNS